MRTKIQTVLQQLNHGLVEREEVLKTTLLAVLAGENSVLIGPPGTGKSLMARRIAESFAPVAGEGAGQDLAPSYFEYLLTKFSTPEEIFGPLSISELKNDRFKRNTAGYLPSVEFAFLDEIFKASSSILNSLLTILNERLYHNGATAEPTPLHALIAASNELPADQDELGALYDRFLVRSFVDYVGESNLHRLFEKTPTPPEQTVRLRAAQLQAIRKVSENVTLPPNIIEAIKEIWRQHKELFKEDRRESLSDRRLKKIIHLLRVAAATNGRREVDLSDVLLLKNCLWNHPDNAIKVRDLILKTLQRFSGFVQKDTNLANEAVGQAEPPLFNNPSQNVVNGFKGSGTEHDPLLVGTLDELMDLARPEIGQKGYFFRQTADIDCSSITTWPEITFQGQYDGGGFTIKHKENKYLFKSLQSSKVRQLKLVVLSLAETACQSQISDCLLVLGNNKSFLFCVAEFFNNSGGIAGTLENSCVVERCYICHKSISTSFSVIAYWIKNSVVRQCGIGLLQRNNLERNNSDGVELYRLSSNTPESSKLENNASIDTNRIEDSHITNLEMVAAARFKQRYFELTLGWDFDKVWVWDDKKDRPALRAVGVNARVQPSQMTTQQQNMVDLLTQQIQANIWL